MIARSIFPPTHMEDSVLISHRRRHGTIVLQLNTLVYVQTRAYLVAFSAVKMYVSFSHMSSCILYRVYESSEVGSAKGNLEASVTMWQWVWY